MRHLWPQPHKISLGLDRPRVHSIWPRSRPRLRPHSSVASLTSLIKYGSSTVQYTTIQYSFIRAGHNASSTRRWPSRLMPGLSHLDSRHAAQSVGRRSWTVQALIFKAGRHALWLQLILRKISTGRLICCHQLSDLQAI